MVRARHVRRLLAAFAVVLTLGSLLSVSTASPATAQTQCGSDAVTRPALTASPSTVPATGQTTVTVTGSGYLVPKHLCSANIRGGVYVFFGWVNPAGNWGPSTRANAPGAGKFGTGYTYPGESGGAETREVAADVPIRFVSFSPGGESGSSTPFHMDGAGNWTTQLIVNGSTYSWRLEGSGGSGSVNCRAVQCGFFTIGAHGIISPTNEIFTPISFAAPAGATAVPGGSGGTPATPAPGGSPGPSGSEGPGVSSTGDDGGDAATSGDAVAAAGEQSTTTVAAADAPTDSNTAATEAEAKSVTVDGERSSSVQDFGDDGRSPAAPLFGVLVGLLLAGGIVAVVLVRRRSRSAGGGEPDRPAAA